MPVYEVDKTKFKVEKQADTWLCWAASARAVALYYGYNAPEQAGLAAFYKDKATGNDPRKALKDQFNLTTVDVFDWADVPSGGEIDERKRDLRDNLKTYLQSGPMFCGLIEASNAKWQITGKTTPYTFRHATVIYKFDSDADKVSFMDPARSDERGRSVEVTVAQMVTGFPYVAAADLGPTAKSILPADIKDISVRMYLLAYFMKSK
jgi:hypothetical protein